MRSEVWQDLKKQTLDQLRQNDELILKWMSSHCLHGLKTDERELLGEQFYRLSSHVRYSASEGMAVLEMYESRDFVFKYERKD